MKLTHAITTSLGFNGTSSQTSQGAQAPGVDSPPLDLGWRTSGIAPPVEYSAWRAIMR